MNNQNSNHDEIRQLEWLLNKRLQPNNGSNEFYEPFYGDVTELNTCRLILDSVGKKTLQKIAEDAIDLLETSVAIYEANGDYAFGMFSSGWCRLMDTASRKLCKTDDNRSALDCGCWLCHENCWNDSAKAAIESGHSTDIQCVGGINLYAEPIYAGEDVVGAINIGYGAPPTDSVRLKDLAETFDIDLIQLKKQASSYNQRPQFIVGLAKKRLKTSASLIGEMVEKSMLQKALQKNEEFLETTGRMARVGGWEFDAVTSEIIWTEETFRIHEVSLDYKPTLEKVIEFYHTDDQPELLKAFQSALNLGRPYDMEVRFITAKGNHLWTRTKCEPEIVEGKTVRLRGTFQDITEFKELEERLNLVIKGSNDAPWDWDLNKNELYYSPQWWAQIGYNADELPADAALWQRLMHPDDSDRVNSFFQNALENGTVSYEVEFRLLHKKGHYVPVLSRGFITRNESGKPLRVSGTNMELTERKQVEEALRKSEALHQEAQRVAKIGHWELDTPSGTPIWSEEIFHIFGLDPKTSEPSFAAHENIIHKDDWGVLEKAISELSDLGKPFDLEFRIRRASGEIGWMHAIGSAEKDEKGDVVRMFGTAQDISNRKHTELVLQESLARAEFLADIIEKTDQPIGIGYPDGRLGFCNSAFTALTGYTIEELRAMDWATELTPPEWLPSEMEFLKKLESTGRPVQYEKEYIKKDGSRIPISMLVHVVKNQSGETDYYYAFVTDIKERKLAEKKILEQKENAERYLNLAGVMFIGLDKKGNVNVANQKAREILECKEAEIIGQNWFDNYIPERMRNDVRYVFKQLMEGEIEPVEYYENPVITKNGNEKHIAWHNTVIIDGNDSIVGILGSGEDVTEKLKLQAQLQQAQKMESIGNLAGGIAHDFNNILSSIIGFTELALDETSKGTTLEDSLQEVYSAGKRAKDLVKQILAFARQSDEKKILLRPALVAKEVLKLIRSTIPTTIDIKQEIASNAWIFGNSTQIHQVLMNLCTNAAHAMEESGGVLELSMDNVIVDEKDYIEIKVSDTGVGIAPEIIGSIFEPYFTTKGPGEGTGMGLAMAQGVVDSHGGKITVNSQLGEGATFTIYLPITEKRSAKGEYVSEQLPTGTERILFVDDELPIAKMGSRILEGLGYSVTTRTSSIEALELFQVKPNDFDLIVTDMTMPNMTGDELTVEMMKIRPDIPIILCTGYSKKISDKTASNIGIKAFAYKPVVKADLAKTVRKVLDEVKT